VLEALSLNPLDYFILSCHREENIDDNVNFLRLIEVLRGLVTAHGKRVIMTTHPRTRKRMEQASIELPKLVELYKPFGLIDYANLQMNALAVLSDSGTINEESSILNFPALNIREAHERPEGMEEAVVMMTGLEPERVLHGLEILREQPRGDNRLLRQVADYSMPNVSEKVIRIIMSYTSYVNRTVWRKPV
jgi:UDP-N-acetylglucosamine 2-epimerase